MDKKEQQGYYFVREAWRVGPLTSVEKQLDWLCVWRESAAFFGNQEGIFHNQIIYSPLFLPQSGHRMLLHKQLSP